MNNASKNPSRNASNESNTSNNAGNNASNNTSNNTDNNTSGNVSNYIGIGADHAGYLYKEQLKEWLKGLGFHVRDFGFYSEESKRDYSFVEDLAQALNSGEISRGICICGTGIAVCMCANKIKGIRAALCNDIFTARKSRQHNDANVLTFGSRVIGLELAMEIVKVWLETDFEGERHAERKKYIDYLESKYFC